MVSNLVWSLFGVAYNWPLGAAVSVIVLLLTLCLLWLANRVETAMNYGGQAVGAGGPAAAWPEPAVGTRSERVTPLDRPGRHRPADRRTA